MTSLGERLSDDEIQTMLNEADENEDGRIDYEGECVLKHLCLVLIIQLDEVVD